MAEIPTKDQIADLLGKGHTVLEISRALKISPQAVYKHINRHGLIRPTERDAS